MVREQLAQQPACCWATKGGMPRLAFSPGSGGFQYSQTMIMEPWRRLGTEAAACWVPLSGPRTVRPLRGARANSKEQ
jgi:hypothetical protein